MKTVFKAGGIFVAALIANAGAGAVQSAHAQFTANNLVCNGCVGYKDLGKNAVRSRNIRKNEIKSKHIKNGQLKEKDLNDYAKPARGAYDEESPGFALTGGVDTLLMATVEAPGPGSILATGTARMYMPGDGDFACEVTDVTALGTNQYYYYNYNGQQYEFFGQTRGFDVPSAGSYDIYLLCDEGTASVTVYDRNLTAVFVPAAN